MNLAGIVQADTACSPAGNASMLEARLQRISLTGC